MAAMFVIGSEQNEHSLETTFHICFLQSFTSFGLGVSEEKIKTTDDGRQTTDDRRRTTEDGRRTPSDGKSSHCLLQGELKRTKGQNKSTKH